MAVSGDFMRLRLLQDRLRQAAQGEALKEMLGPLRDETNQQVGDCFREQRDPYGRQWPPRKKPKAEHALRYGYIDDGHALLDKTGKLLSSIRTVTTATGIKVTMASYAMYHWQPDGPGGKLPQRSMLPTARQGLGPIFGDAYLRVSGRVARAFMGTV